MAESRSGTRGPSPAAGSEDRSARPATNHPVLQAGRGLTTRGRCLLAGGVAASVCAVVLDERDLFRVGLLACALPLVAMVVIAVRRVRVGAEHQVFPDRLQPGTTGQVVLTVSNQGTRTPALEMTEPGVPGLTSGLRTMLPPIHRAQGITVRYPIAATQRGRFVLGPPRIRVYDPFDLWEDNRELTSRTEVLVVPTVLTLTGMPSSSGARSAASGRARVGTTGGDPDVGIRPYHSGDDIRTIHWRASARHDELVVRLAEPVSHGGATVILDHRTGSHRGQDADSSLETAVVLAASVTLHLLASDHRVRLVSHRGDVLAEGHDISDDVLAGLAQLEPDSSAALRPIGAGRAGLVVAVVADLSAADAMVLAATRPRGADGVALVLDAAAWALPQDHPDRGGRAGRTASGNSAPSPDHPSGLSTGPGSVPGPAPATEAAPTAARVLGAAGWRTVVIRPGDDLGAAWRRACAVGDDHLATGGRVG